MRIFQYAIYFVPGPSSENKEEKPKILKEITSILAKDEKSATILASRDIPQEFLSRLDEVSIAVRPF